MTKINKPMFKLNGSLPLTTLKEGDKFIVFCPILDDISSYGDTYDEALNNFSEALSTSFLILHEEGKLEEFLTSCGWQFEEKNEQVIIVPPLVIKTVDYTPELNKPNVPLEDAIAQPH